MCISLSVHKSEKLQKHCVLGLYFLGYLLIICIFLQVVQPVILFCSCRFVCFTMFLKALLGFFSCGLLYSTANMKPPELLLYFSFSLSFLRLQCMPKCSLFSLSFPPSLPLSLLFHSFFFLFFILF